jgi:hypothetical protein
LFNRIAHGLAPPQTIKASPENPANEAR